MPDSTRGSIYISTADEIGETLVEKLGGSGYTPNEWDKSINLCGISDADIPTALENIEESADGTERGSFEITKANSIASVLNKKFKTTRGFKPKEWASAVDKLTALQVKNASGAIASFKDGADDVPIASASFSIVPYQNLNGYSKPWASGCGKNLLNDSLKGNAGGNIFFGHDIGTTRDLSVRLRAGTYVFSVVTQDGTPTNLYIYNTDTWEEISGFPAYNTLSKTFTLSADTNLSVWVYKSGYTSVNDITHAQIEEGSSATSWEPYSNVCPITPYSQMTITKSGVNLWNGGAESGWINNNGSDSPNADRCRSSYISIVGGLSYYFVCGGFAWRVYFYDRSYNFISYIGTYTTNRTITAPDNACYLRFALITTEPSGVSVNYPATKADAILPKNIQIIVDSFGRSIYGGSRSCDGTLTETEERKKIRDFGSWIYVSSYTGYFQVQFDEMKAPVDNYTALVGLLCEVFKTDSATNAGSGNVNYTIAGVLSGGSVFLRIKNNDYNDVTQFLNDFGDYYVVYPLADPVDHALEPLPEINSYYGDNNIYTDIVGGESSVNYRADIDLSQ